MVISSAPTQKKSKLQQDESAQEKDYRFMTALERGLSVLRIFPPGNRPLGNAEIAKAVGLPKATVTRITFTLTKLGYLRYDTERRKYQLGPGVLSLGYNVLAQMEIRDTARSMMRELADYADASIYLAVPDGTDMVYVEACRAPTSMVIRLGVGSRVPMAQTSIGRCYLAALPKIEREKLLERIAKTYPKTAWTRVRKEALGEIAAAEKRGYAVTIGGWISESNSAGCVIRRGDGYPVYAINVGGLASLVNERRIHSDLGPRLVKLARQIEKAAISLD
ncbi:IclR family transcriptional regulator [Pelagibius litoralis]|uniref:IclR family transcriptional regulator n=1 Tax=Pelagibius litoralis TaxID=374515 RepID=A0A967KHM9_9PROT|nr:IclR family transcriptional regulator [Pelagibius litoralis]NIA71431.1 IclR family transcriptional regulator [Pelagibius litoralis]